MGREEAWLGGTAKTGRCDSGGPQAHQCPGGGAPQSHVGQPSGPPSQTPLLTLKREQGWWLGQPTFPQILGGEGKVLFTDWHFGSLAPGQGQDSVDL